METFNFHSTATTYTQNRMAHQLSQANWPGHRGTCRVTGNDCILSIAIPMRFIHKLFWRQIYGFEPNLTTLPLHPKTKIVDSPVLSFTLVRLPVHGQTCQNTSEPPVITGDRW
jgi:hypothetical protein